MHSVCLKSNREKDEKITKMQPQSCKDSRQNLKEEKAHRHNVESRKCTTWERYTPRRGKMHKVTTRSVANRAVEIRAVPIRTVTMRAIVNKKNHSMALGENV
jgi:hypothetical protein